MKRKRIIALLLCFIMLTQLMTAAVPAIADMGNDTKATGTVVDLLENRTDVNLEGFHKLTLTIPDSAKEGEIYTSNLRFDASLKDSYLQEIASPENNAFQEVYTEDEYASDPDAAQAYIENVLIAYDTDGTTVTDVDFTALPDIQFTAAISSEITLAIDDYTLGTKNIVTDDIEQSDGSTKTYNLGWWMITQETEGGDYTLTMGMNKVVYALYDVACGFNIKVGMRASQDANATPQAMYDSENMKLEINDVGDGESENPDAHKPAYIIEKTAASETDSPVIEYGFTVTGEYGADINGTIIKDVIPEGMEVTGLKYVAGDGSKTDAAYEVKEDGAMYVTLPDTLTPSDDAKKTMTANYAATMQMTAAAYQTVLTTGGINKTITNKASLLSADGTKTLSTQDATASTDMEFKTLSKDGEQDATDGTRMNWTLGFNLYGTRLDAGYIVDTLDTGVHNYRKNADGSYAPITIVSNTDTKSLSVKTTEYKEGAQYSTVDVAKLGEMAITDGAAYVYNYTESGTLRTVMIIPVREYLNKGDVEIKYSTELVYEEDDSVDNYLNNTDNKISASNDARLIWKNYYYGVGPGTELDNVGFTINKKVDASYSYGTKEADGSYDEVNQIQKWKFTVNHYGGNLRDVVITDTLDDDSQVFAGGILDGEAIEASYVNRSDSSMSGIIQVKAKADPIVYPYYEVVTETGTTTINVYFGDITSDDYYVFDLATKVKDVAVVGGNITAVQVDNTAVISGTDANGVERNNSLDASTQARNTIITKDAINFEDGYEYDYETRALKWKTTVNQNYTPITNEVITDTLPTGTTLGKVTSVKMYKKGINAAFNGTIDANNNISFTDGTKITTDAATAGIVTFSVSVNGNAETECAAKFVYEYTTIFSKEYEQSNWMDNESHTVINNAALTGKIYGKDVTAEAKDDAQHNITASLVSKAGKFDKEEQVLEWALVVNKMGLDVSGKSITDDLTGTIMEFMENTADTPNGVKVERLKVASDGSYTVDTDETVVAQMNAFTDTINQSIKANKDKKFEVTIPNAIGNDTIRITYKTYITDNVSDVSTIKNKADIGIGNGTNISTGEKNCDESGAFDLDDYAKATKNPTLLVKKASSNQDADGDYNIHLGDAEFAVTLMSYDSATEQWSESTIKERATAAKTGNAIYLNIKRGNVYKVVETEAPTGYQLDTTVRYVMFESSTVKATDIADEAWNKLPNYNAANKTINTYGGKSNAIIVSVTDTPLDDSKVTFKKIDNVTQAAIAGAKFKLVDNTNRVESKTAVSAADGTVAFENLDPGTYTLTEICAPAYYDVVRDAMTVTVSVDEITNEYSYTITGSEAIASIDGDYTISDDYMTGTIAVKKVDSGDTTVNVKGTVFAIRKSDAQPADDDKTATTGTNGIATFTGFQYNPADTSSYVIYEKTATPGYQLGTDTISFTMADIYTSDDVNTVINKDNTNKSFQLDYSNDTDKIFKDARLRYHLVINKKDENNNALQGIQFTIKYTDNDSYAPFTGMGSIGTVSKDGKQITVVTGEDGTVSIENLAISSLPTGTYTITENAPAAGDYVKAADVTVTWQDIIGANNDAANTTNTVTKDITNVIGTGNFKIHKTDRATGEALNGVSFKLTNDAVTNDAGTTLTTDENGDVTFTGLKADTTYTLTEAKYGGYQTPEVASYKVETFVENGTTVKISITPKDGTKTTVNSNGTYNITNAPLTNDKNSISILKQDDDGNVLEGATFGLYTRINGKVSESPIQTQVTDENGATFTGMAYGNYVIKEISAPTGYEASTSSVEVTKADLLTAMHTEGTYFEYTVTNPFVNTAIRNTISLTKTVSGTNTKKVSGAEFTIFNEEGEAVAFLVEDGQTGKYVLADTNKAGTKVTGKKNTSNSYYLSNKDGKLQLAYGTYYMQETTTPAGYVVAYEADKTTLKKTAITVTTAKVNQMIINDAASNTYTNARALGNLEINKTVESASTTETTKVAAGEGFTFKIAGKNLWGEGVVTEKYLAITAGTIVEKNVTEGYLVVATNANGQIKISGLEPTNVAGLTVTEVEKTGVTDAYVLPASQNVKMEVANNAIADSVLTFDNKLKVSNITGTKVSDTAKKLSGAVMGLYVGDTLFQNQTVTTGADGSFTFENIPYGEYTVKEITAPTGYILGTKTATVKVTQNGAVVSKDTTGAVLNFTNELAKKSLTIVKSDKVTGSLLSGVKFTLKGKNIHGEDVDVTTSTLTDGTVTFANIPTGTYTLSETKQIGYESVADMAVEVKVVDNASVLTVDGKIITGNVSVENAPIHSEKSTISLVKKDQDGNLIRGCKFGLFMENNNTDTPDYEGTTGNDGKITFTNVVFANYTLKELEAPNGYNPAADVMITKAQIIEQDKLDANNTFFTYSVGTITNTLVRGSVTVIKTDGTNIVTLSGAKFDLYADEACETKIGSLTETSTKGTYEISNPDNLTGKNLYGSDILKKAADGSYSIAYGTYYMKETVAPVGYIKDEKVYTFNIATADENVTVINDEASTSFVNQKGLGSFTLTKKIETEDGKTVAAGAGFTFKVTGTSVLGTTVDTTITTDTNGKAALANLEKGTYTVTETASVAAEPYVLAEAQEFTIDIDTNTNKVVNAALTFTNMLKKSDITGTKVSNTGKNLENATLGLFKKGTTEYTEENTFLGMTAVTDANGKFTFADVPYGEYEVAELAAPTGHYLNAGKYPVKVTEDGVTVTKDTNENALTIVDDLGIFDLAIAKTDDVTGQVMGNVSFTLTGTDVYGDAYTKTLKTDSKGSLKFEGVPVGTYTLSEAKQVGYEKMDDLTVEIVLEDGDIKAVITKGTKKTTLDETGDTYFVGNTAIINAENQIKLIKVDQDGNPVKGCTFGLFGPENQSDVANYTATSGEDGWVIFTGVRYSDYTLKELSAPEGYTLCADVAVTREQIAANMTVDSVNYVLDAGSAINTLTRGTVTLTKVDETTGNKMSGAGFTIYADTDCTKKVADLVESSEAGVYVLADKDALAVKNAYGSKVMMKDAEDNWNLAYGTYYLKETTTPVGYLTDENTYEFSITENGQNVVVDNNTESRCFTNKRATGSFTLTKYKEVTTETKTEFIPAEGVSFRITGVSILGTKVDEMLVTGKEGKLVLSGLETGTYTVEEVSTDANKDYVLQDKFTFDIVIDTELNKVVNAEVSLTNKLISEDVAGIVITDKGEILSDVTVGMFKAGTTEFTAENAFAGNIMKTGRDGKFYFANVPIGEYVVAQITDAGDYKKITIQIPIHVTGDLETDKDNLELVFVNEKEETQTETTTGENKTADGDNKTGDQAPIAILIAAMLISMAAVVGTSQIKKKNEK